MQSKLLDHGKQFATDSFNTVSKRQFKKQQKQLTDNKFANRILKFFKKSQQNYLEDYQKITKVSKNSQQNNSETVTNENDEEIPKERCNNGKSKHNKPVRQYNKSTN